MVGVAEDIARAVDAGALAIPDAEHAVIAALAAQFRLLAPHSAVAARSSLRPGWKRMLRDWSSWPARWKVWSTPPSGEPR